MLNRDLRVLYLFCHNPVHQGNGRELLFSMVDGDFKKFEGKWSVKAGPRYLISMRLNAQTVELLLKI